MPDRPDTDTRERPSVLSTYQDAGGRIYGLGVALGTAERPGTWQWSPTGRDGGRLELLRSSGGDAQYAGTFGSGAGAGAGAALSTAASSPASSSAAATVTDTWSTLATYAAVGAAVAVAAALALSVFGGR